MERDRRAGIERVIELGRWLILIFAGVTANFSSTIAAHIGEVNLLLGSWALFNLAVTLALVARHLPGRRTQYAMTGLDITVATALIYLTGGFASSFSVTFYVVVIASSLRFGIRGSVTCATIISIAYIAAGMAVSKRLPAYDVFASHIFLYFVVALATGLLARELAGARARQIAHTYELEHAAFMELREVDRLKTDFIMLASHELRTPLAKIKAWLMLMQDAGDWKRLRSAASTKRAKTSSKPARSASRPVPSTSTRWSSRSSPASSRPPTAGASSSPSPTTRAVCSPTTSASPWFWPVLSTTR